MKKEKKSKSGVIMALVIAFLMVGSILGYVSIGNQGSQVKYKDIKFKQNPTNNLWYATINGQRLAFDYLPLEVEQIEMQDAATLLNKPQIDVTSEINDTFAEEIALAQYNLALTLSNLNVYIRRGFTTENVFNTTILTCQDATSAVPIIYFKQSNQTQITIEDNCIIAEARNNLDLLRIKDRLLYSISGVMG